MSEDCLEGKVCVVCGGSSGVGKATASRLIEQGAEVAILARRQNRLDQTVAELGDAVTPIQTDVSDPSSVRAAFAKVNDRWGRLDVVFNVAGVTRNCLIENASDDDITYVIGTNLLGPIYTTRAAIPIMRGGSGGIIVNVTSEAILEAPPLATLYSTSKVGLTAFSGAMTNELRGSGIRVCACVLGRTADTSFAENFAGFDIAEQRAHLNANGYLERIAGRTPMEVGDVAEALVFMASRPPSQMLDVVHVRASG